MGAARRALAPLGAARPLSQLFDAELLLNLLERNSLCFGHDEPDPHQLAHHARSVEGEDVSARFGREHWKSPRYHRGHDPMGETAKRLASGTHPVREDFADEDPDYR